MRHTFAHTYSASFVQNWWKGSLAYHEQLANLLRFVDCAFMQRIQMGIPLHQVADEVRMVMAHKNRSNCRVPSTLKFE